MKITLQYVNDGNGRTQAIQMSVSEWEKVMSRIKKSEQILQLRSDLKAALQQAKTLKATKTKKQTLAEFLNEL